MIKCEERKRINKAERHTTWLFSVHGVFLPSPSALLFGSIFHHLAEQIWKRVTKGAQGHVWRFHTPGELTQALYKHKLSTPSHIPCPAQKTWKLGSSLVCFFVWSCKSINLKQNRGRGSAAERLVNTHKALLHLLLEKSVFRCVANLCYCACLKHLTV